MRADDEQDPRHPGSPPSGDPPRPLPLLPLRDMVVFPGMVVPLFVGRERSIAALEAAMAGDKEILLVAQRRAKINDPQPGDLYRIGTLGSVIQLLRLPDRTLKVLVEGRQRAKLGRFLEENPYFLVEATLPADSATPGVELEALIRAVRTTFEACVKLNKQIPPEMLLSINGIEDPGRLADAIAANLRLKQSDKQEVLELDGPVRRLERLYELMQAEIEILQVEKKIRSRVKHQMEKSQKEYYLNEQMQAIQKELGERDEFKSEIAELEEKIAATPLSEEAATKCQKELMKLKLMAPMSAEAVVVRNYVDWILALPWGVITRDELNLQEAAAILEHDHYGLDKAKERILEYLAVQSLAETLKGPILCFVGPPGVGKTSLARSIARATGRKFVRLSLGGVRDEAEVRGHRRTYIGALPGKIIQSLRKAGSCNPVFLLDEVDKLSSDWRGDPASALLEVLDPEQNNTFNDHFLDVDFDLSRVMFITTANNLHAIPAPLQDRMEILTLPGYTEFEKLQIALRYLVTKQKEANGIGAVDLGFAEGALKRIINEYTREAGVRNLEREIASICRKVARKVVEQRGASGGEVHVRVTAANVPSFLDVPRFKHGMADAVDEVGVTNGLAVTMTGGDLLTTEVALLPGKGKFTITGKLGEVMQESAQAAMSYVRSRATTFGLPRDFYQSHDFHIHFPEGAIPKDGPSAGITMATSIVSALTGRPVRRDVAMTGEITLRGRVLEIGGLKEKLLAAHRGGIGTVLIPIDNAKDLKDVPAKVRKALTVIPVRHMDEVLRVALVGATELFAAAAAPDATDVTEPPAAAPVPGALGDEDDDAPAAVRGRARSAPHDQDADDEDREDEDRDDEDDPARVGPGILLADERSPANMPLTPPLRAATRSLA